LYGIKKARVIRGYGLGLAKRRVIVAAKKIVNRKAVV